jgi:hypothetical protein
MEDTNVEDSAMWLVEQEIAMSRHELSCLCQYPMIEHWAFDVNILAASIE